MVTKSDTDYPIVGYNVIVQFIDNCSDAIGNLSVLMKDSDRNSKGEYVKRVVYFIQTQDPSEIYCLKNSEKDIMTPSRNSVKVPCDAIASGIDKQIPVIFELPSASTIA